MNREYSIGSFYYPYLSSSDISSKAECSIQRHTEKETYAGLLDEYRVGISLIFYLENGFEYRERKLNKSSRQVEAVNLTGLAMDGKFFFRFTKRESRLSWQRWQQRIAQI